MKRRNFIGLITLGIAGSTVGVLHYSSFEDIIEKIIIKDTDQLEVSSEVVKKYIMEGKAKNIWEKFNFTKREFFRAHYLISNSVFQLPYYGKYIQYRSELVGHFLLSTDFFINKMKTDIPINYVALYDPYFRPCSNPFSNLYY